MKTLPKPKNTHALVILLLIENHKKGLSMKEAMQIFFHKFGTRLLEIEKSTSTTTETPRSLKLKINRLPMTTIGRCGTEITYTQYKSLAPLSYLYNLYIHINDKGINGK